MAAERAELAEKINGLQNQIYKNNEKLDQFKMLMNWNQEELEQWALAERQKAGTGWGFDANTRRGWNSGVGCGGMGSGDTGCAWFKTSSCPERRGKVSLRHAELPAY